MLYKKTFLNKKLKILETKIQQFVIKKCKHISAKNLTVYLKVIFWIKNVSIFDRKKGNFWHNKFFFLWLKKVFGKKVLFLVENGL